MLHNSLLIDLDKLADCHAACFPDSFATKLGKSYVKKTLEWFLVSENRFIYHITHEQIVTGYCGGFIPQFTGDGSSSGMLQYAFKQAVLGVIKKPWLLFNAELVKHYPLIWKNIRKKILAKSVQPNSVQAVSEKKTFAKYVGLVVIGVHPQYRGSGIFNTLMEHFFEKADSFGLKRCILSVKQDNARAIKAYEKYGWHIIEELGENFVLEKIIA